MNVKQGVENRVDQLHFVLGACRPQVCIPSHSLPVRSITSICSSAALELKGTLESSVPGLEVAVMVLFDASMPGGLLCGHGDCGMLLHWAFPKTHPSS